MFAADYPFEQMAEAGKFMDETPLDAGLRKDIAFSNAFSHLGLTS